MSKLAQAGESSTVSPGRANSWASCTAAVKVSAWDTVLNPAPFNTRLNLGIDSPISITARQRSLINGNSSDRSVPLSRPPAMSMIGGSKASRL